MAITINNGIANIDGTPGAISGVFSNRPAALNVAEGTLYFATDTAAIYQAVAGSWVNYAGGGGGTPGIDDVLSVGQLFTNDRNIDVSNFEFTINNLKLFKLEDTALAATFLFQQNQIQLFSNNLGFETNSGDTVTIGNLTGAGLSIELDNTNDRISVIRQGAYNGLDINFGNGLFLFGDYDNLFNNVSIGCDSLGKRISTSYNLAVNGLDLNFNNLQYKLGDFSALGLEVFVDLQLREISLKDNSLPNAFILNFSTQTATLYDFTIISLYNSIGGGLFVDNSASIIGDYNGTITTDCIFGVDAVNLTLLAGADLLVGSSGSVSGQHLKIKIGGNDYVIELKNP